MSALATATYEWETGSVADIEQHDGRRWTRVRPRRIEITAGGWLNNHQLWIVVEGRLILQRTGEPSGRTQGRVVFTDSDSAAGEPIEAAPPWVQNLVRIVREWERRRSEYTP